MLRLGLVCDFAEERWVSMDLVGDMLLAQMCGRHGNSIRTERIQPAFRRRVTAARMLRDSRTAWNGDRLWNRMVEYPRSLRSLLKGKQTGYDLFHIVDHSYAHLALDLGPNRTVVTCHDLDAFRCLTQPAGESRPYWFRLFARRILNGLQAAAHVVFVSDSVRREAIALGLVEERNSSVIYNGVDEDPEFDEDADREARRLLGIEANAPLLMSVGSTAPRKRIDVLLRVFAAVATRYPAARLIRAGGPLSDPQWALAGELGIAQSIIELPFLERPVLNAVYRRATVLLQPSEAEGFGLPVAEAMARGCPVVASDIPVLREIGGEGAIYCEAGNVPEWTASVIGLLDRRREAPTDWNEWRGRAIESARRFQLGEHSRSYGRCVPESGRKG